MIQYLSGQVSSVPALRRRFPVLHRSLGVMRTPDMGNVLPPDVLWAADNAALRLGDWWDLDDYCDWLVKQPEEARRRCLFAVTRDAFGDAETSLMGYQHTVEAIASLGYRPAYVAQPGATPADLAMVHDFAALFIGGPDHWNLGDPQCIALMAEARRRDMHVHVGRVNTWERLRAAYVAGADSVDGTNLAFGAAVNGPILAKWMERLSAQRRLFA